MKAIRLPSGDHVGLVSRSTPGEMNVTVRLRTSRMPMKPWSARSLTKASFDPSGDHRGFVFLPAAFTSGFSPLSTAVAAGPRFTAYA
jgi:hypothetical protein